MKSKSAAIILLIALATCCLTEEGSCGDIPHGIRCSLNTSSNQWIRGAPAPVTVTIENASPETIQIEVITSFELGEMQYWAPVKLGEESGHLPANTGYELRIRPGKRRTFEIDLSKLKWEKSVSSVWPHRDLFELVPSGNYKLGFDIELRTKGSSTRITSNRIDVRVQ